MLDINIGRIKNRLRAFYKTHFSLFLFITLALLLAVGLSALYSFIPVSTIIALVLLSISLFYYYSYFKRYKLLTDTFSHHKNYYYEIFSTWGIITFNILFILIFAYVGSVLAILFPDLGFGKASFYSLLVFILQTIFDGISLGLLGSYSLDFSNLKIEGLFAKSYIYAVNLIINMAFIASLASVITETIQIRRELKKATESTSLDKKFFDSLTPLKVKAILKQVKNGALQINKHESELFNMLKNSTSKEAKDVILQILQSTNDKVVFQSCVNYFSENKDFRFQRVCKRIKKAEFRGILKKSNKRFNLTG